MLDILIAPRIIWTSSKLIASDHTSLESQEIWAFRDIHCIFLVLTAQMMSSLHIRKIKGIPSWA